MQLSRAEISAMEKRYRAAFVNSLSGFKSANLIGTISTGGAHNLCMVSSVVHLGSDPALLAFMSRPHTVRRDTLENIHATGQFTINHVRDEFFEAAHQTAARYEAEDSEFDAAGLTPETGASLAAPYVAGSPVQIGLEHRQTIDIELNGCHMVIGEIIEVRLAAELVADDGSVDLGQAGSLVVSGLDHYHQTRSVARLSYAKPDLPVHRLSA